MLDFFKSLFSPPKPSGATAKERLKLVLLSDHLSLAPDVVESLKRDLLEVISRYVEIDASLADVSFEQRDSEVAMLANIPITGVRARERPAVREGPPPLDTPPPVAPASAVAAPPVVAPPVLDTVTESEFEPDTDYVDEQGEPVTATVREAAPLPLALIEQDEPAPARTPTQSANGKAPRRRRRRKKSGGNTGLPASPGLATGSA